VKGQPNRQTERGVADAAWMDVDLADRTFQDVKSERMDSPNLLAEYFL
jgi:hypothetical protein